MIQLLNALIGIGIQESFSPRKAKAYRLANSYTLCAMLLIFSNSIINAAFGLYAVAIGCFIGTSGLIYSFTYVAKQKIFKAEMIAVGFINFSIISAVGFAGEQYWNHLYFVPLIIAYMVIFGPKYSRTRNQAMLVTTILFAASFFSGDGLFGYGADSSSVLVISRLNLLWVNLTLIFFFYAAINQNRRVERILSKNAENAENAGRVKSDFLSVMSHEIRTPLNAILGVGHLLSKVSSEQEREENIAILNSSTNQLVMLVNDILDYNKLEAGKIELYQKKVDLKELLENTFQMFANQAEAKGLDYVFDFDKALKANVITDGSRINQVIANLLSNAIKFSKKGTVSLRTSLVSWDGQRQLLRFEVIDSGIGISEEKQKKVFESFTQAGAEVSVEYGGTGLGLSICKKILELYGTEISVHSKLGEGSMFGFELYLETPPEVKEITIGATVEDEFPLEGMKVLLAEDNLVNQTIMRKFFEKWKVNFKVASNGHEVLELLEVESFNMVLMDLQMPMMDGLEASRRIRGSNSTYSQMPIIALTANTTNELSEQVHQVGINAFVSKPFVPSELIETMSEFGLKRSSVLSSDVSQGS